jgi:PhoPQ-activated pathogenicity-related protein
MHRQSRRQRDSEATPQRGRATAWVRTAALIRAALVPAALVAAALAATGPAARAEIMGSWDFSTGSLAPQTATTGMTLSSLPTTPYYAAFGGTPNPPPLQYGTTTSFGIADLGDFTGQVLRMPNMQGRGSATGLIATFPVRHNGETSPGTAAANLNRYTLVMDVLVPAASFAGQPYYLDLFQPRASNDGSLFIDKRNGALGSTTAYGGTIAANQWNRIALVMDLDAATSAPRYSTYLNGTSIGQIIWDDIVVNSTRNYTLKYSDLVPDGLWSICSMAEMYPGYGLPSDLSSFYLFNDNNNELGELYVANMLFRDDALSAADVAALGGPAGGVIAVPEPGTFAILVSGCVAIGFHALRRTSRRSKAAHGPLALLVAAVAGACGAAAARADDPPAARADGTLAAFVRSADPATRHEPIAAGEVAGGRWRTVRLVSQSWRGVEWVHELSLFLPSDTPRPASTMLLWIDGGSATKVPQAGTTTPSTAALTIAAVANASGLPAAVIRQVPHQPMFDGLAEDALIAYSFVQFVETGDRSWPLLLPMVKAAVTAMDAATEIAAQEWDLKVERFVVTGGSKRGWTTWLTAAVDPRVQGLVPMVIDMLSLERHIRLQHESFGRLSEHLDDYTSRDIERLLQTPRGRELIGIVDPYAYRDRIAQPKLIALGTNDPYWPLESHAVYLDGLAGPRWLSCTPNAGHDLPAARVAGLVTDPAGTACVVESSEKPAQVVLWTATAGSRDFRKARWASNTVTGDGREWRVQLPSPESGFAAALVECHYDRSPLPLVLTTAVHVAPDPAVVR